ncbi:MAG: phospholipase D family protein, partial [bacterium]
MSPRRNAEEQGTRLLSLWERPEDAGEPMGCVATTFTFDSAFFEEHCLGRFLDMDSDPVEDQRAYLIEREEKFSQMFACVLVDRAHVAAARSLRWHLCPVTVPGGGILHAKVSLLVWRKHVRVIVSSANLTPSGYRMNFEQAGVLDFTPDGDIPLAMLHDVLGFLDRIRVLASQDAEGKGPNRSLAEFI